MEKEPFKLPSHQISWKIIFLLALKSMFFDYMHSLHHRVTSHFGTYFIFDMISDGLALLSLCFCHLSKGKKA